MIGATGAVGSHCARTLAGLAQVERLTLLGRRPLAGLSGEQVHQHTVDLRDRNSYAALLPGHDVAICTVGVGEPSKVSREQFVAIDKQIPLDFGRACRTADIAHFELLASVGVDADSRSFFLRTKGELIAELKALEFARLSVFEPSMILTPTNRYGLSQALVLWLWPLLNPLLIAGLRKYRGIRVEQLGQAMARAILEPGAGQGAVEVLRWDDFIALSTNAQGDEAPATDAVGAD